MAKKGHQLARCEECLELIRDSVQRRPPFTALVDGHKGMAASGPPLQQPGAKPQRDSLQELRKAISLAAQMDPEQHCRNGEEAGKTGEGCAAHHQATEQSSSPPFGAEQQAETCEGQAACFIVIPPGQTGDKQPGAWG